MCADRHAHSWTGKRRRGHRGSGCWSSGGVLRLCGRDLCGLSDVVARLTELSRNRYGAAFRSHTGRWEPLPGSGTLGEMAQLVATLLQPYLQSDNY